MTTGVYIYKHICTIITLILKGRTHMLENTRFETDFRKPRVNKFRLWHVPINSDELSFKVGPSNCLGSNHPFPIGVGNGACELTWIGVENGCLFPIKEGPILETKLLEVYKAHVKAEILLPWLTKIRFETNIYKCVNKFQLWHVPINSEELSFKVGPSLFGFKPSVSNSDRKRGLRTNLDRSWERMFIPNQRGTDLGN